MHPVSIVDKATIVWSFETQPIAPPVSVNTYPLVDFLLLGSLAKFEST